MPFSTAHLFSCHFLPPIYFHAIFYRPFIFMPFSTAHSPKVSRSFCNFSMSFLFVIIPCSSAILRNIAQSLLHRGRNLITRKRGEMTDESSDTKVTGNFMLLIPSTFLTSVYLLTNVFRDTYNIHNTYKISYMFRPPRCHFQGVTITKVYEPTC